MGQTMTITWETWPERVRWAQERVALYRAVQAALWRRRGTVADLDAPLWDCLDRGDPFCFCRSVDTVERVRLRDEWENTRSLVTNGRIRVPW